MDELKPCPFCGGEAQAYIMPCIGSSDRGYVVECDQCWAKTGYYELRDGAIAAWNRRAEDVRD